MREELKKNEEVVFIQQNARVIQNRGHVRNEARRYVRAGSVVAWLLLALIALSLWLMRLLGTISLPG